jgi:hypothetical protein
LAAVDEASASGEEAKNHDQRSFSSVIGMHSSAMSQVELTQLQWAGQNLKRIGPVTVETAEIVASAETDHYSVLYLRAGDKVLVKEGLDEIERLSQMKEAHREVVKRFKREIRECKAMGMSVDEAFAALWEELSTELRFDEGEQSRLYQELLDWTKRWLK